MKRYVLRLEFKFVLIFNLTIFTYLGHQLTQIYSFLVV